MALAGAGRLGQGVWLRGVEAGPEGWSSRDRFAAVLEAAALNEADLSDNYAAMLEDSDKPLDQQQELIETLWSIVVMSVDLGYDINPVPQICGED